MKPSDIAAFTPLKREHVTEMILAAKHRKRIKWADVAGEVGKSKEWVTAGCLGQMTFTKEQAEVVGKLFELLLRKGLAALDPVLVGIVAHLRKAGRPRYHDRGSPFTRRRG